MDDGTLRSVELLHRARVAGYAGGKSALYALAHTLRPRIVVPFVRFDGLAGEFSQHDFGEVLVRYQDGTETKVHFFASRLKYSRWAEVTLVSDERVETLVRTLVDHLAAFGGIPLVAVFDRPKTVALRWGRDGVVTEWNPTFAGVVLDLGLGVEVCWPCRPQEKGAIENLVGWVKGSFFKQRRFLDREDLERQLREWLTEGNTVRPSRATGVPPAARIAEERARLRPLKIAPADLALRIPVSVGPTGVVIHDTHPYSMPPDAIGLPGTLYLHRDRVPDRRGTIRGRACPAMAGRGRLDPPGASRGTCGGGVGQARPTVLAAPALNRSRPGRVGVSDGADASPIAYVDPRCGAAPRTPADTRRCGPAHRVRPRPRGAGHRGRVHRALPRGHDPGLALRGAADDDSGHLAAAHRPGPGRRRRPAGRSEAEHLDAAEHGGILPPRRRPVMIAARG